MTMSEELYYVNIYTIIFWYKVLNWNLQEILPFHIQINDLLERYKEEKIFTVKTKINVCHLFPFNKNIDNNKHPPPLFFSKEVGGGLGCGLAPQSAPYALVDLIKHSQGNRNDSHWLISVM